MKNLGNLSLCKTSATSDNTELLSFQTHEQPAFVDTIFVLIFALEAFADFIKSFFKSINVLSF